MSQQVSSLKKFTEIQNKPPTVNLGNQMFVIQGHDKNIKNRQNKKQIEINAIFMVNADTKRELVIANCQYIKKQVDKVFILCLEIYSNLLESCSREIFTYQNPKELIHKARYLIEQFPLNSWYILQDAHEMTSISKFVEPEIESLRKYIEQVDQSPYMFNAIPSTIFFTNDGQGNYFEKSLQYKIYDGKRWNLWNSNMNNPKEINSTRMGWEYEVSGHILNSNTLNRVKLCKKVKGEIFLVQHETDIGNIIISDVMFKGRKIYPYHLLTIRHHPKVLVDKTKAYAILYNEKLQYSFGATIKNGYLNSFFTKFSQKTMIY